MAEKIVSISLDEEVAARPPNQAKTTLDDSTSKHRHLFEMQVCEIRPKLPEMAQIGRFAAKQYGKFFRNWALLRQGRTLAEIRGCSLAKAKQCGSLKQEIGSRKSTCVDLHTFGGTVGKTVKTYN